MKLIVVTLSRHVASPSDHNNDSSRPGRYIMPRKRQGTIIPVMNTNRHYPVLLSLKLPHFDNRITPFFFIYKYRASQSTTTLGLAQNPSAKLRIILQISKLYVGKIVIMEYKPPYNQFSSPYFHSTARISERPVRVFSPHHIHLLSQ